MEQKKLFRSEKDRVIAGVCSGLAIYLNVDVTLVRLIFLAGLIFGFSSSFWIYIIMWLLVPSESSVATNVVNQNIEEMKEKAKKTVQEVKDVISPKEKDKE